MSSVVDDRILGDARDRVAYDAHTKLVAAFRGSWSGPRRVCYNGRFLHPEGQCADCDWHWRHCPQCTLVHRAGDYNK